MNTLREKIEEIVKRARACDENDCSMCAKKEKDMTAQILSLFEQTMGEAIGEDENYSKPSRKLLENNFQEYMDSFKKSVKNELRTSQRARLKDIIGGEKCLK